VSQLTTTLIYGGNYAEAYCVANDFAQAQGWVFEAVKRIVEASPYVRREACITANKITFPMTGVSITAIAQIMPVLPVPIQPFPASTNCGGTPAIGLGAGPNSQGLLSLGDDLCRLRR
jgi:hypothetical protein